MSKSDKKPTVAAIDEGHLKQIRNNVSRFVANSAVAYDKAGLRLLDIAPQVHEGAAPYFKKANVQTLDIDPSTKPTYVADLCVNNRKLIADGSFDLVVCTEVLEHVTQPFKAVAELHRLLKPQGLVFVSTPFDLRIHGPLPDCWRFTEHGLRVLFENFEIIELKALENPKRWLMPIHYTVIAKKL